MATTSLVRCVPRVLATARRVRIQLVVIRARKDCGDNYVANIVLKDVRMVCVINLTVTARVNQAPVQTRANIYAALTV